MSTEKSLRPSKDWCRAHSYQPGGVTALSPSLAAKARARALANRRPPQQRKQP